MMRDVERVIDAARRLVVQANRGVGSTFVVPRVEIENLNDALSALTPQVGLDRERVALDEGGRGVSAPPLAQSLRGFADWADMVRTERLSADNTSPKFWLALAADCRSAADAIIAMLGGPESMGPSGVSEQGRPVAEGLGSTPLETLARLREELGEIGFCGPHNALIPIEEALKARDDALVEGLHDALAIMRRASDVLADYPEHETLTRSLRASCRKAFEALPHHHEVCSNG